MQTESEKLKEIAQRSIYAKGTNAKTILYSGNIFLSNMVGDSVLELGPAEGLMTDILYPQYKNKYTVVDAAPVFVKEIKKKYPKIEGIVSLFEEYETECKYDNIILGHVLEHVENPVSVLCHIKNFLSENGRILAAVPNCYSIHRQAAVKMGLMKQVDEMSEKDKLHGHRRVYSIELLHEHFKRANLSIIKEGGYWLKPLSDKQIEKDWTESMLDAFMSLGEQYPSIAAEIYIIATL